MNPGPVAPKATALSMLSYGPTRELIRVLAFKAWEGDA